MQGIIEAMRNYEINFVVRELHYTNKICLVNFIITQKKRSIDMFQKLK